MFPLCGNVHESSHFLWEFPQMFLQVRGKIPQQQQQTPCPPPTNFRGAKDEKYQTTFKGS